MSKLRLEIELDCPDWDKFDSEEKLCFLDLLRVKGDNLWHNNDIGDTIGNIKLLQLLEENPILDESVIGQYDLYAIPSLNDNNEPYYVILTNDILQVQYIAVEEGLEVDLNDDLVKINSKKDLSQLPSYDWEEYIPYGYNFLEEFHGMSVIDILNMKEQRLYK